MRIKLIFTVLIVCVLLCLSLIIGFAEDKAEIVKLEAENATGQYVTVDDAGASGGRFIGVDHTLDNENNIQYYLVYENAPKCTEIKMIYATPGMGDVVVYVEENGRNIAVGSIYFPPSGDWYPYGGDELEASAVGFYIPEGSKVTMIATGSVNIDYFEFIYNEEDVPKPEDGKQDEDVKNLNNVFLSDLKWVNSSCHNQESTFSVHTDRNYLFEPLQVAGTVYDKGLGMTSGHYEGAVFVEIDIEGLGFTTFASYVGLDDKTVPNLIESNAQFIVEVDGEEKARSGILKMGDDPELLVVDITGAKRLKLYTSPAGDGIGIDCCVWGNTALGRSTNVDEIFATPTPAPTPEPTPTAVPTDTPEKTGSSKNEDEQDNTKIYIIIVAAALVVAAIIVVISIKKKAKDKGI